MAEPRASYSVECPGNMGSLRQKSAIALLSGQEQCVVLENLEGMSLVFLQLEVRGTKSAHTPVQFPQHPQNLSTL